MIEIKPMVQTVATAAVMALLAGAVGYFLGTSETEAMKNRIEKLEASQTSDKSKLSGRFIFMNDATQMINHMCQDDESCRRRFAPLRVPE